MSPIAHAELGWLLAVPFARSRRERVWGALAGSFLLLARKRIAVVVFGLSLLGLIVVAAYEYTSQMPTNTAQNVVIWAIALFLLWYARAMVSRGVLR